MNLDFVSDPFLSNPTTGGAWVLGLLGKSFLLVLAGFFAEAGLRKASAATRHGVWVTVFCLLLTLFVASTAIPYQRVEISAVVERSAPPKTVTTEPGRALSTDQIGISRGESENPGPVPAIDREGSRSQTNEANARPAEPLPSAGSKVELSPEGSSRIVSIWLLGIGSLGSWLLFVYGMAGFRYGFGGQERDESWEQLLDGGRKAFGIRRTCRIRLHRKCRVPMTLGIFLPRVVLPVEANGWNPQRRKAVLWHELAHVRRWDSATQLLARIGTIIFWPNVLCWIALRRMHHTREEACDDAVLRETGDPESYASELVETVRGVRRGYLNGAGVAMASSGGLKERVAAILDGGRNRNRMNRWIYASGFGGAAIAGLLGMIWITAGAEEGEGNLGKQERTHLEKILKAIDRNADQFGHGYYEGESEKQRWENGSWDQPPMPAKFEAWIGGTRDRPAYRIDYQPLLTPWREGAAPYFIENVTWFSDGSDRWEVPHDRLSEARKDQGDPIGGLQRLPGMRQLLHLSGAERFASWRGPGAPPHSRFENYLRIALGRGPEGVSTKNLQMLVGEEPFENVAAIRFEVLIGGGRQRERWWMDPARGYALLGADSSFRDGDAWRTISESRVLKLTKAGEGFWFPEEVRFERNHPNGEPMTKEHSRFRNAKFGPKFPNGFFTKETIIDAIRLKQLGDGAVTMRGEGKAGTSLRLILIDSETDSPLPEVEVKGYRNRESFTVTTDSEGRCEVSLGEDPGKIENLKASVRPEGYVPTTVSWRRSGDPLSLPAEYRLALERGTEIGGRVVDESGEPIAGATVHLGFRSVEISDSHSRGFGSVDRKTDEEGNWRYPLAPKELNQLTIHVDHPDFATEPYFGGFRHRTLQPFETLYDFSANLVMKKGRRIAGRILDRSGEPVANAAVRLGRDRWGANYPEVRSDETGNYEFANVKPERDVYITVEAKGHSPALSVFRGLEPREAIEANFELDPAQVLRVRIVDEEGTPLAGVVAVADTWREETRAIDFRVRTSEDGRFVWQNAPEDPVLFDLLGKGVTLRDLALQAGEEEQTVVLRPAIRVHGAVVDAKSGMAIPECRVVLGRKTEDSDREIYWREDTAMTFSGGKFTRTGDNLGWLYYFRAEADGYEPEVIGPFRGKGKDLEGNFRLKPAR